MHLHHDGDQYFINLLYSTSDFYLGKNFLLIEIFPSGIPFLLVINFCLYEKKTSLYPSFSLGFCAAQAGPGLLLRLLSAETTGMRPCTQPHPDF